MMTQWHTETYRVPRSWFGTKVRTRILNVEGRIMIDDLDPTVAVAIVAEHNEVVAHLKELHPGSVSPSEPI